MAPISTQEMPFGTMLTAMVTPFKQNLDIDYDAAAQLAVDLVKLGNDGIVVNGTTGEAPTTAPEEKAKLLVQTFTLLQVLATMTLRILCSMQKMPKLRVLTVCSWCARTTTSRRKKVSSRTF